MPLDQHQALLADGRTLDKPASREHKPRRRSQILAWGATLATSIAAGWHGLAALFGGPPAEYDSIIALTWLTVVGLAWSTYFTRETLEHARETQKELQERDESKQNERRKSFATAVLAELYNIGSRVRVLAQFGPSGISSEFITHPVLTKAAEDPTLFGSETIEYVDAVARRIRDVQLVLDMYPRFAEDSTNSNLSDEQRAEAESNRVETYRGIRVRAAWAYNRLVDLVRRLQVEGGRMPADLNEPTVDLFHDPPLRDDPFTLAASNVDQGKNIDRRSE